MKLKVDYKRLIEDYKLKEGKETAEAVFNIANLPRTAPTKIIQAIVIALAIYAVMIGLLIFLSSSWILIFIALVVGFTFTIALSITHSLKLIADDFLTNIFNIMIGLLLPVEKLYAFYRETSVEKITKEQFVNRYLKESFVPKVLEKMPSNPFKGKLQKILLELIDQNSDLMIKKTMDKSEKLLEKPKQATLAVASTLRMDDDMFIQNMKLSIQKKTDMLINRCSAPFYNTLKYATICWGVIWLIHVVTII